MELSLSRTEAICLLISVVMFVVVACLFLKKSDVLL